MRSTSARARLLTLLVTLVTGLVVLLSPVQPAQAGSDSGLLLCQHDSKGGWCENRQSYDTNFKNDQMCGRHADGHQVTCTDAIGSFNDQASSVDNNTGNWWKLFEDTKYGGFVICLRPHGYDNNLGNNTDYEDDLSSVKKMGTSRPSGCDQVIG